MSLQQFAVSENATAWIRAQIATITSEAGRLPVLCFAYNYQAFDKERHLLERCASEFFLLGWSSAEVIAAGDYLQVEIGGCTVFLSPHTLKELAGNELILDTVDVGFPTPSDEKCELLRAVAPKL